MRRFNILLLIIFLLFVTGCSDDNFNGTHSQFMEWYEENSNYKYQIIVSFGNTDDIYVFEQRLLSIDCDIIDSDKSNENITYTINSHLPRNEQFFQQLTQCYNLSITCNDSDEFITPSDIHSVVLVISSIKVGVTSDYYKYYDENDYVTKRIKCVINDDEYELVSYQKDGCIILMCPDNEDVLASVAIAMACENPVGEINIKSAELME